MDLAFANSLAARALRLEHRFESTEIESESIGLF